MKARWMIRVHEKVKQFRNDIFGNWERIGDWRERVEEVPEGARPRGDGIQPAAHHLPVE